MRKLTSNKIIVFYDGHYLFYLFIYISLFQINKIKVFDNHVQSCNTRYIFRAGNYYQT